MIKRWQCFLQFSYHQCFCGLAYQAGARKVYAVEASDMAEHARQLISQNPGRSCSLIQLDHSVACGWTYPWWYAITLGSHRLMPVLLLDIDVSVYCASDFQTNKPHSIKNHRLSFSSIPKHGIFSYGAEGCKIWRSFVGFTGFYVVVGN